MLNELPVEGCYKTICNFANEAPISDVVGVVKDAVCCLKVNEPYSDMMNQISVTVVANRELKELKGEMAGYRRYINKLKTSGQILALKKYYKQDKPPDSMPFPHRRSYYRAEFGNTLPKLSQICRQYLRLPHPV